MNEATRAKCDMCADSLCDRCEADIEANASHALQQNAGLRRQLALIPELETKIKDARDELAAMERYSDKQRHRAKLAEARVETYERHGVGTASYTATTMVAEVVLARMEIDKLATELSMTTYELELKIVDADSMTAEVKCEMETFRDLYHGSEAGFVERDAKIDKLRTELAETKAEVAAATERVHRVVEDAEAIYDALWPDGSAHDPDTLPAAEEIELRAARADTLAKERDVLAEMLVGVNPDCESIVVYGCEAHSPGTEACESCLALRALTPPKKGGDDE